MCEKALQLKSILQDDCTEDFQDWTHPAGEKVLRSESNIRT